MHIKTKVRYKRYFLLTGGSTLLTFLFARSKEEILGILVVYAATILNHYMMMRGVKELVTPYLPGGEKQKADRTMMLVFFIGKLLVLFGGIYVGVLLMGNRVIIPVLNYVIQIFLLIYSLSDGSDT